MKTFLLGVGAQKAGTSFLYSSLMSSQYFHPGFCKEYHVFDGLSCCPERKSKWVGKLLTAISQGSICNGKAHVSNSSMLLRALFYEDISYYFEYFEGLSRQNPCAKVFADFTPSYSGLGEQWHDQIRSGFESRGFQVKVCFLMREPLQRALSAAAFLYPKKDLVQSGELPPSESLEHFFRQVYRSDYFLVRGRYEFTCNAIERIYGKSNVFYGFYENMFTSSFFDDFMSFLGVEDLSPDFSRVVNKTNSRKPRLDEKTIDDFRQFYGDTYSYVFENFPRAYHSLWA
ncbi:MAG: hypothetical protein QUV04_08245 [Synechococcus sp. WH 8007]|nr:hypothetical protein [Synechococcus sp. WH 8007]